MPEIRFWSLLLGITGGLSLDHITSQSGGHFYFSVSYRLQHGPSGSQSQGTCLSSHFIKLFVYWLPTICRIVASHIWFESLWKWELLYELFFWQTCPKISTWVKLSYRIYTVKDNSSIAIWRQVVVGFQICHTVYKNVMFLTKWALLDSIQSKMTKFKD